MDFTKIAVLKPYVPVFDHQRVRVLSLLQEFEYDASSVESDDGITVITPPSGVGRWLRDLAPVPTWTAKTEWYQDSGTGDDENAGDATSPVRTLKELTRRLRRVDAAVYRIYQMAKVDDKDSVQFTPEVNDSVSALSSPRQTVATIHISGEKAKDITTQTGTFTAVTKTDPAMNVQATVAEPGVPWSALVGRIIQVTSGASKNAQAVILKQVAPNVARVSEWYDIDPKKPIPPSPVAGDKYAIVTFKTFEAPILYAGLPSKVELVFQDMVVACVSPGVIPSACTTAFISCQFAVELTAPPTGFPFDCFLRACAIHLTKGPNNFSQTSVGNGPRFEGCGLIDANVQVSSFGRTTLLDTVLQGGSLRGIDNPKGRIPGGLFIIAGRVGVFDSVGGPGVNLRRAMVMCLPVGASLYGEGNAFHGVEVSEGACLAIQNSVLPTITGALGEVQLEGNDKAIPELKPGSPVPALKELKRWKDHWKDGFARNVFNYRTGSKIISTQ